MARALRGELRGRFDLAVTHSECLEIVARQHGVDNWNILAARRSAVIAPGAAGEPRAAYPWGARNSTIPVLRIFAVDPALQFYVDFLGFTVDFGGPNAGPGTPYYGQVSRLGTTLHLAETAYDAGQGCTVFCWIDGVVELRERLNQRRTEVPVWGPAVWTPQVERAQWDGRVLTVADPFGNHLRFGEPADPAARAGLPRWA
ncbi:glyoxalase superfamily protein [Micromonospora sp. WMMD1102]|uniref:glyoxalase superfamily protein n=1 Tax=Micromonospora sp. WMMD1102 TaxID=3016105 RepID=UPI002414F9A4|nr:glyoxalase superfamily protein [Micromonospora sp. WMMD1102]MDG4787368.1 glyoxalase superfamily protein [Micromonospora sp. WMMD1102]